MTKSNQNILASEQKNENTTENLKGLECFDLESLKVSQDFVKDSGVKKLLTTVPVRKPNRQDFVRVHPDSSYVLDTMLLNLKEERETYLVAPSFWDEIPQELTFTRLALAANRQKVIFLWQLRLPDSSGKTDTWSLSALEAYEEAKSHWVRVSANMSLGAYEIYEALGELSEPEWPDESMTEIVRIAFRNSFIDSVDHPVLRRLRGES
ncbi:MAG: hypothetical protein QGG48_11335 [Desulfatiglandales bacterium]|nr:hypothetical protein [Desulfatiglandales bacterium]